jgi:hypothetical protein
MRKKRASTEVSSILSVMLYSAGMTSGMPSGTSSALFRAFPIGGSRSTSLGPQPVPYHVYDGEALFIGGWVDPAAARGLIAGQNVEIVTDRRGRALASIWACEFTQASLGPHCELQLSLAVTRSTATAPGAGQPDLQFSVRASPFELVRLLLLEPGVRLFSAALWNDTPQVVAYNRELLGLDAHLATAHFSRGEEGGFLSFRFEDPAGRLIFQGDVAPPAVQPLWDSLLVERGLGAAGMRKIASSPWLSTQVMAPGGPRFAAPSEAQTWLHARSVVLSRFSQAASRLAFGEPFPAGLDFKPAFLEHFTGFEFVYLPPYNHGDAQDGPTSA